MFSSFISNRQIKRTDCTDIVMACNHANTSVRNCLPSMIVNTNEATVTICLSVRHIANSSVDVHKHIELVLTKTSTNDDDEVVCHDDDETPEQFNWYCDKSDVPSND